MSKNYVQDGETLPLTAPAAGTTAGTCVKIGSLLVLPAITTTVGLPFEGQISGVIEHAKLAAQAWTEGQVVCWDDGNARFTTVTLANYVAGVAARAADNPSSTGFVRLNGVSLPAAGGA